MQKFHDITISSISHHVITVILNTITRHRISINYSNTITKSIQDLIDKTPVPLQTVVIQTPYIREQSVLGLINPQLSHACFSASVTFYSVIHVRTLERDINLNFVYIANTFLSISHNTQLLSRNTYLNCINNRFELTKTKSVLYLKRTDNYRLHMQVCK